MRRLAPFSILPLLLLLVAPLQAQDVTGTWELTYATQRGERTMTVTFKQEGATVTGTVEMPAMGGRPGGPPAGNPPANAPARPPIEIKDGKMDGNVLTFSFSMGMGERAMTQTFSGTVSGNTMEGTMTGGMRQADPIPFKGVKK